MSQLPPTATARSINVARFMNVLSNPYEKVNRKTLTVTALSDSLNLILCPNDGRGLESGTDPFVFKLISFDC